MKKALSLVLVLFIVLSLIPFSAFATDLEHTHNYEALVTPPACTEKSYTTHTRGDSYVDDEVPAMDNKRTAATSGNAMTYSVCGKTEDTTSTVVLVSTVEGTYINSNMKNAEPSTSTPYFNIAKYQVTPGCRVQIAARMGEPTYCAWVDADGNRSAALRGNKNAGVNVNQILTVPDYAVYLEVSYVSAYALYVGAPGLSDIMKIGLLGDSIASNGGFLNTIIKERGQASGKNVAVGGWFYSEDTGVNNEYPGDASKGIYRQVSNLDGDEDLIIIWAGTNDFGHSHKIGEFFDESGQPNNDLTTLYGGLHRVIQELHAKLGEDIPIIICTPLERNIPQGDDVGYPYSSQNPNKLGKYLQDYIDAIKAVADYYGITVFVSAAETNLNPNNDDINRQYFSDGLHPNSAGHAVIGTKLSQFICQTGTGHSYGDWTVTAPTCTEKGYTTHICTGCGASYVDSYTEVLGHDMNAWTQTKAPTCTEKGEEKRTCSRCDHSETREVAAKSHSEVIDKAVAPTCTTTGLTEGKHCSVCNEILVAQQVIVATGHSYGAWYTVTEPGEYTEGLDQRGCQNCDHYETRTIAALGHTHSYDAVVTAPTCTEKGYTTYTCRCGDAYTADEVAALGHDMSAWTQTKAPACTEKGKEERTCSRCDHSESREVAAKGHSEVIDKAVAPTCTTTGLTEGKHCSVCNAVTVAQEVVPALGHTEVVDVAVAPTCTATGLTEGKKCSNCGEILQPQEVIPVTDHSYGEWTDVKAPTTEEVGLEERICSGCNRKEQRELPKLEPAPTEPAPTEPAPPSDETPSKINPVVIVVIVAVVVGISGGAAFIVLKKKQ